MLEVSVYGKRIANVNDSPLLTSGSENYDRIKVSFDSTWDEFTVRYVIFYRDRKTKVYQCEIEEEGTIIPTSLLAEDGELYFGFVGTKVGDLPVVVTTEVMKLRIHLGALEGQPFKPTASEYGEIQSWYAKVVQVMQETIPAMTQLKDAAASSASSAKASEDDAAASASSAKESETNAKGSETNAKASESNAAGSAETASLKAAAASGSADSAATSASSASSSAAAAKTSETNSKTSEENAKTAETNAASSAVAAQASKEASASSAVAAKSSEDNAKESETNAKSSETKAKTSETNAAQSEANAKQYAESIDPSTIDAIKTRVTNAEGVIGSEALSTTAQTLTGAINEINGDLHDSGRVITASGSAAAVANEYSTVCTLQLLAGHTYLVLGWVDLNIDISGIMNAMIILGSGSADFISTDSRTIATSGGGCMAYAIANVTSDASVLLQSFGYIDTSYNFRGRACAIRLD